MPGRPSRWPSTVADARLLRITPAATAALDDPLVGELPHGETGAAERSTVLSVQSLLQKGGDAAANVTLTMVVTGSSSDAARLGVGTQLALPSLLAEGLPRGTQAVSVRFS